MKNIVETEKKLAGKILDDIDYDLLKHAKQNGFSDEQIGVSNKF